MSAPNGNGNGNGNGDWAASFAAFHERHKDRSGKKLKFTSVWNTQLEAWMDDPEVPLEWRCLAFAWRFSQGNSSDYCVASIGGPRIGQKECAERFAVDKRRISDAFRYLKGLYYIEPDAGYAIRPVDNPAERQPKSPCPSGLLKPPKTEFQAFVEVWKVHAPADYEEFESASATVNRIKRVRWGLFREWKRARTHSGMPVTTLQHVGEGDSSSVAPTKEDAGGRVVLLEQRATEPPARPPETALLKTGLNERGLFPDDELVDQLTAALGTVPFPHFFRVLDQRLERGRIGTGLLMKQAAKARDSYIPAPEPEAPKCWSCGQPIAGSSINGACFDCFERQSTTELVKGAAN